MKLFSKNFEIEEIRHYLLRYLFVSLLKTFFFFFLFPGTAAALEIKDFCKIAFVYPIVTEETTKFHFYFVFREDSPVDINDWFSVVSDGGHAYPFSRDYVAASFHASEITNPYNGQKLGIGIQGVIKKEDADRPFFSNQKHELKLIRLTDNNFPTPYGETGNIQPFNPSVFNPKIQSLFCKPIEYYVYRTIENKDSDITITAPSTAQNGEEIDFTINMSKNTKITQDPQLSIIEMGTGKEISCLIPSSKYTQKIVMPFNSIGIKIRIVEGAHKPKGMIANCDYYNLDKINVLAEHEIKLINPVTLTPYCHLQYQVNDKGEKIHLVNVENWDCTKDAYLTYLGPNPRIFEREMTYLDSVRIPSIYCKNNQISYPFYFQQVAKTTSNEDVLAVVKGTYKVEVREDTYDNPVIKTFCQETIIDLPDYIHRTPGASLITPSVKILCSQIEHDRENEDVLDIQPEEYRNCIKCFSDSNVWTALGCVKSDITGFVSIFYTIGLGIAGGIAFLFIIYAGFLILFSGGDPEKVKNGREIFISSVAGLILFILAVLILRLITVNILKIPGFE